MVDLLFPGHHWVRAGIGRTEKEEGDGDDLLTLVSGTTSALVRLPPRPLRHIPMCPEGYFPTHSVPSTTQIRSYYVWETTAGPYTGQVRWDC